MAVNLVVVVVDIALPLPQVHRLRLDALVRTALVVSSVVWVTTVLVRGAGTVAAVRNINVHRVELLDRRVDVVPQGRSRPWNKIIICVDCPQG